MNTKRYLIPRTIIGITGRNSFDSDFILIEVNADVRNDHNILAARKNKALELFDSSAKLLSLNIDCNPLSNG